MKPASFAMRTIMLMSLAAGLSRGASQTVNLTPLWDTARVLKNPDKGWYHHYYDNSLDKYLLKSDADLDDFPGMNHLYIRVAWSYLEPQEGRFNWPLIDDLVDHWTPKGYKFSFRITCKETGITFATPQWVKDAGAAGAFFGPADRPNWAPDYGDPVFLEKLDRFHQAFAARYDGKPWVQDIDVGSIGEWGEGHNFRSTKQPIPWAVFKQHIDLYSRHYRRCTLTISDDYIYSSPQGLAGQFADYVVERGFAFRDDSILVDWYVKTYPGTFTMRSPELFQRTWQHRPNVLELEHYPIVLRSGNWKGPNGAEFGADLVRGAVELSHATFIGYHGDARQWLTDNPALTAELANRVGYWYFPQNITLPVEVRPDQTVPLSITWLNRGVAPAYKRCLLQLRLESSDYSTITDLPESDNRQWMPDQPVTEHYSVAIRPDTASGRYAVKVALLYGGPDGRPIDLGLQQSLRDEHGFFTLAQLTVR